MGLIRLKRFHLEALYGDDQFANLSVPLQNAMPLDTHESAKPSGILSSPNSLSTQTFSN